VTHDASRQFAPLADDYAKSRSHAEGQTLDRLVLAARPSGTDVVLDVATGAGATALALAPRVRLVVAHDLTPSMAARARRSAQERGLGNVHAVLSPAERLPFAEERFDLVTCRTASHHFDDVGAAVREMRRVVRPGGRVVLVDQVAAEDPALRALQHDLEVLHDATHRRTYTPAEWRSTFEDAGLVDVETSGGVEARLSELPEGTNVADWCLRSRTPPEAEREIRRRLAEASAADREALGIAGDGPSLELRVWKVVVTGRKA
jgi:ubiquinone/menaquinone biosynthesis C-methylase UbiE